PWASRTSQAAADQGGGESLHPRAYEVAPPKRSRARRAARRCPAWSAAARGRGIAAPPPALAKDREVQSEPRGKRSAAGSRAQRAARRCLALAPPPPTGPSRPRVSLPSA